MRQKIIIKLTLLCSWGVFYTFNTVAAQDFDCTFKIPVLNIDFGAGTNLPDINLSALRNYRNDNSNCPQDGFFSFSPQTGNCFNGDWFLIPEDHTPGDYQGKMMVVNAAYKHGVFFYTTLSGLNGNTMYELSLYLMNVCRISGGCPPLPPNIVISLQTAAGKVIAEFETGQLSQGYSPVWKKYSGGFTTPADATALLLKMENITDGGCGNDFAMDDIIVRECMLAKPVAKQEAKPVSKPLIKTEPPVTKPVAIQQKPSAKPIEKADTIIKRVSVITTPVERPVITRKPVEIILPKPIETRANPIIKKIETTAAEMEIDLYDNGEVDGDTVSIYHNNELIVSRAGLSAKAVSFRVTVDAAHPHHEVVMVANNLGSIPPNTSLMIITANGKRYEVFISSSEEKNAKVVIDWKP